MTWVKCNERACGAFYHATDEDAPCKSACMVCQSPDLTLAPDFAG
jgi:hypothetical protein